MNILIAADYATPCSGNFIASCVELGRRLHMKGDTLTFIVPENHYTLSPDSWIHWLEREGCPVYLIKKELPQEEQLHFLQRVIREHEIEVLHLHFGMFHHLAVHRRKELPVKILVHDHMDFAVGTPAQKRKEKLRCIARSARYRLKKIGIISVNPVKNRHYFLAKHWYVPNSLSFLRNVPASMSRTDCRQQLGFQDTDHVIMLLGWDMYRKGFDIAMKAVAELRKTDDHACLAIVGMGCPAGQAALEFIRSHTDVDPESPWIHFLPSTEDMFAYHRAVDVYLSASRSEAFSYGILESISQNTPVAVSDIKGTGWCRPYDKTVQYPVEDAGACAKALQKALELGRRDSNYQKIIEEYNMDKWCDRIMKLYKNV